MRTETIDLTGDSSEAVLRELATYAHDREYVAEPYVDALLKREREYPTGLEIAKEPEAFGVAIPHADPEHVREQAVILGLPDDTATFRSMDDPDREIEVDVVILLLVTETENYSSFLSNMTKLFQDESFADAVRAKDAEALVDMVVDRAVEL